MKTRTFNYRNQTNLQRPLRKKLYIEHFTRDT